MSKVKKLVESYITEASDHRPDPPSDLSKVDLSGAVLLGSANGIESGKWLINHLYYDPKKDRFISVGYFKGKSTGDVEGKVIIKRLPNDGTYDKGDMPGYIVDIIKSAVYNTGMQQKYFSWKKSGRRGLSQAKVKDELKAQGIKLK